MTEPQTQRTAWSANAGKIVSDTSGLIRAEWEAQCSSRGCQRIVSSNFGWCLDIVKEKQRNELNSEELKERADLLQDRGLEYIGVIKDALMSRFSGLDCFRNLSEESKIIRNRSASHYDTGTRVSVEYYLTGESSVVLLDITDSSVAGVSMEIGVTTEEDQLKVQEVMFALLEEVKKQSGELAEKQDSVFLLGERDNFPLSYSEVQFNTKNYLPSVAEQFAPLCQEIKTSKNSTAGRLVILEGPPGTGKTFFIRSLVHQLNKTAKFVYCPVEILHSVGFSKLMERLISFRSENDMKPKDALVLFVEDGDEALLDRSSGNMPILSTVLNITSGVPGDSLNCTVVITTNSPKIKHDKAVSRAGRLLRMIEFQKLPRKQCLEILTDNLKVAPEVVATFPEAEATLGDVYAWARKVGDQNSQDSEDRNMDKKATKIGF